MAATTGATQTSKIEARVKVIACSDGKCLLPSVIRIGK